MPHELSIMEYAVWYQKDSVKRYFFFFHMKIHDFRVVVRDKESFG